MAKLLDTAGEKIVGEDAENTWGAAFHHHGGDGNDNARHAKPIPYQDRLGYKDIPQPAKDSPFSRKRKQVHRRAKSPRHCPVPEHARGTNPLDAEEGRIHARPPTLGDAPPRETLAPLALHVRVWDFEETRKWDIVAKQSNVELPRGAQAQQRDDSTEASTAVGFRPSGGGGLFKFNATLPPSGATTPFMDCRLQVPVTIIES